MDNVSYIVLFLQLVFCGLKVRLGKYYRHSRSQMYEMFYFNFLRKKISLKICFRWLVRFLRRSEPIAQYPIVYDESVGSSRLSHQSPRVCESLRQVRYRVQIAIVHEWVSQGIDQRSLKIWQKILFYCYMLLESSIYKQTCLWFIGFGWKSLNYRFIPCVSNTNV